MTRLPSIMGRRRAHTTLLGASLLFCSYALDAQQAAPVETPQQELQRLTEAVEKAQAQVDASQRQLLELKQALTSMKLRLPAEQPAAQAPPLDATGSSSSRARAEDAEERQAIVESQVATIDQIKVESESRYPVKITGEILFNTFVNTSAVDQPTAPSIAIAGAGSTGASLRQTILGIDARGPNLAGAASRADVRVDFFGDSTSSSYASAAGLLRLRTAHATLDWSHTQAFFSLDRPIISPNNPTSLTNVASPALSWSGNLWIWAPQLGLSHTLGLSPSTRLTLQAALIDVPDPPAVASNTSMAMVSQAEQSRWPGSELHLGLLGKKDAAGPTIGVGGYFSPHRTSDGFRYNAWAATLDLRLPLPAGLELSGSFYRGVALGGLGGGAYKDYLYAYVGNREYNRALDDVGGWAQMKKRAGERLEFNAAYGIDNAFAGELQQYSYTSGVGYQNLARNHTLFANAIYSPSAYLLFSLQFNHITTIPLTGPSADTNVIGIAAGYKF